jgi:hypothetical protein
MGLLQRPRMFGCRQITRNIPPKINSIRSDGMPSNLVDAKSEEGKDYRLRSWQGDEPFRDNGPGQTWLASRTKVFCEYDVVKRSFASLNIGAYHSKDVRSYSSLLALPSSRVSLAWAQFDEPRPRGTVIGRQVSGRSPRLRSGH